MHIHVRVHMPIHAVSDWGCPLQTSYKDEQFEVLTGVWIRTCIAWDMTLRSRCFQGIFKGQAGLFWPLVPLKPRGPTLATKLSHISFCSSSNLQQIRIIFSFVSSWRSLKYKKVMKIIPTRCNNCGLFFANALLYMFRVTIPPIIRSTCAVYGHR